MTLAVCIAVAAGGPPPAALAQDRPSPESTRAKLERLLQCQQAEKTAARQEQERIEAHRRTTETFLAGLSTALEHRRARATAQQALAKDGEALAKVAERIRLADLQIEMTVRAMKYLPVEPGKTTSFTDSARERLTQYLGEWAGRYYAQTSTQHDEELRTRYGFLDDPGTIRHLTAVVERLQAATGRQGTSITIRILDRPSGADASATASTLYFDKAYLDTNPSDDELLFVTAHELAHVQLNHYNKGFLRLAGEEIQNVARQKSVEGSHPIYENPESPFSAPALRAQLAEYYQEQELQADLLGAQQALAAGASAKAIRDSMGRLQVEDLKQRLGMTPAQEQYDKSIATHPTPTRRLQALEESLGEKFWEKRDLKLPGACHHP